MASGPVHRRGPVWHDPALLQLDDPEAYLMAPATAFYARAARTMRAAILLCASASMTPALPALFGLA